MLEQQEYSTLGPGAVCELVGYGEWAWERAIKDPRFVTRLKQLGVSAVPSRGGMPKYEGNLQVCLASDPEEELAKDIWICANSYRTIHGIDLPMTSS